MWESDRKRRRHSQWWVPVLAGLFIALAQVTLVYNAWDDCGVDTAAGLTTSSLYALGVPALTFLNAVLVALPTEVYYNRSGNRAMLMFLTVASVAILVAATTVILGHYVATPAEPVGTACVDNVPTWWPEWMPT
jgi:hypothetical protein